MLNNGKICVSVCAETADEFRKNIKLAEPLADFVELRFDCLKAGEMEKIEFESSENQIRTFRPLEQGGKRKLSLAERRRFWNSGDDFCGGDFEEDVVEYSLYWLFQPVICSYHDFSGTPANLLQSYERLKSAFGRIEVIKIAVQANDLTDTIPLWQLLAKAKSEDRKIIPLAMGESGKWTRILGLAHGAFMTYASLDEGRETAPGQVSVRDLTDVYRAKQLNEETSVYGILGNHTSVSMSPYIHNTAFKYHHLNAVFVPLQVHNLDEFIKRMVRRETREIELNFRGFSVTIPHKQSIIKHLDFLDETAEKIGAVNTVKIVDDKLYGYNTDAAGFLEPLKNTYGDLRSARVAVIGAGGAARAVIYTLKKEGANVTVFARNLKQAESLAGEFGVNFDELKFQTPNSKLENFDILVNTTPLGMRGRADDETPATADQMKGLNLVYDLVYIPFQTRLMVEADRAEIPKIGGMAMLIAQAAVQQKIWTGLDAPIKEMSRAVINKLQ